MFVTAGGKKVSERAISAIRKHGGLFPQIRKLRGLFLEFSLLGPMYNSMSNTSTDFTIMCCWSSDIHWIGVCSICSQLFSPLGNFLSFHTQGPC